MSRGPVVTNTTPLINLSGVGLLDILPQLYGEVWAPRAVISEFQAKATSIDPDLNHISWLKIAE
jgi:predicted nucleic acid-binding protein